MKNWYVVTGVTPDNKTYVSLGIRAASPSLAYQEFLRQRPDMDKHLHRVTVTDDKTRSVVYEATIARP